MTDQPLRERLEDILDCEDSYFNSVQGHKEILDAIIACFKDEGYINKEEVQKQMNVLVNIAQDVLTTAHFRIEPLTNAMTGAKDASNIEPETKKRKCEDVHPDSEANHGGHV